MNKLLVLTSCIKFELNSLRNNGMDDTAKGDLTHFWNILP